MLQGGEHSLNKDLEASRSWGHCLDSLAEAERKQGCLVQGSWIREAERRDSEWCLGKS